MNKTKKKWINACNSRILRETMVALGALKEQTKLNNLPIHEIQVHLLDEDGDGIILCLEYDERSGEINKTFHNTEEYYYDGMELDSCASPENVKEFLQKRIEETISEEYDEIFAINKKPPSLLN